MLTKFETKSNRVKALSFHPKRPWILSGLHNGTLQLWDYKIGTLVDRFDEHEGPVRGVAFHPTQPLFVSGADDYKIKVWNWKQRRCLFTLNGHLDYIRGVSFHNEHPWIISCSDDQTIRIWNWQSRNCIATLTGHTYYVMSALFHPKEDLVVSASLDQTIRVWDISGLRKKHAAPQSMQFEDLHRGGPGGPGGPGQPDMFGNTDVVVKYVLEGHDRGVNYATFHPNLPLIVSGSDDRQVKLWRYNETRAWEVDTLRGHYNNVSTVLFHPRQELVISNSEDKTICVWDMNKRTRLHTFRQEQDRFWTLCAHPELNLFAAGHDSGFTVFKLERERPAQSMHQNQLFYIKDKTVRVHDFASSNDVALLSVKKGAAATVPPRTMSYNPAENSVLLCSNAEGGTYELYNLPRDTSGDAREASGDIKKGQGQAAVFVGRNRFAVLNKQTQQIVIKDLANQPTKNFKTPGLVNDIFYGGSKNLILVTPTSVMLFDTELRSTIAELNISGVRYAVWSPDQSMVALFSKNALVIATKQLEQLCLIHETIKIKSGAWDEMGVFVYSTQNHIKYALPQGDVGIIRTVEVPIYLTKVKGKSLYCLDRDGKIRVIMIDPSEYRFKLALVRRQYDEVLYIIRTSNLVGQSIIAYLQKKGYPEVALHFVKETKTRFELALQCGNLEVAEETAKVLDREECWNMLGQEALRQGNQKVLERTFQRVKNFDRLSFLYLITGNTENLRKMLKIAELRGDPMSRYHNSLYLGDVDEQVRLLKEVGQSPLAYLAAKTHGLEEEAASILAESGLDYEPVIPQNGELLKPPAPILKQIDLNWPQLTVARSFFEGGISQGEQGNSSIAAPVPLDDSALEDVGDWDADDDLDLPGDGPSKQAKVPKSAEVEEEGEGEGWDLDDELDLPDDVGAPAGNAAVAALENYIPPAAGPSVSESWVRNSQLAADHIAAGSFETAMQILNRQVGAVNFAPLKPLFMAIFQSSKVYLSGNASVAPLSIALHRAAGEESKGGRAMFPYQILSVAGMITKLQEAYTSTAGGKFSQALDFFVSIIQSLLFTVASRRSESDEIQQLLVVAREYILGLKMELARRDPSTEPKRAIELAAYFTHCQLQPLHLQLVLSSAMTAAYRYTNYNTACQFARRLLEMGPSQAMALKARKLLAACENNQNDEITLDYNQHNPFSVCAASYTPIYRGSPSVSCPYCAASYKPEFKGQLCAICNIAAVGATGTGLKNINDGR
ncbi:coatomer WD associated region-domain-containing protein [Chytriomyces cf. hyalinus JEL632]|nr:coatomer WD associated region-domain-containing protein [Chytriomyces cf. hyalinus JEL632]